MKPNNRSQIKDCKLSDLTKSVINSFINDLGKKGFANTSIKSRQRIVESFIYWIEIKHFTISELNEYHVNLFLNRLPNPNKNKFKLERASLHLLLKYFLDEGYVQQSVTENGLPFLEKLKQKYLEYLRNDRGLTEQTVRIYQPFINEILSNIPKSSSSLKSIDASNVRDILLKHALNESSQKVRLLATVMRSFFHYTFLCGEGKFNLSSCIPTVRQYTQCSIPAILSPKEVDQTVLAIDQSTAQGKRNHVILLLLSRLGLRVGEVVSLELDDLCWQTGEIIIRGKGQVSERLPLLMEIGESLIRYLKEVRHNGLSRRVFIRMFAPYHGLNRNTIGYIVHQLFIKTGIRPKGRGATHLYRHSLATKMINHGASLTEIGQVLRHRSQNTTAIYAKVDFNALRGISRTWPTGGLL